MATWLYVFLGVFAVLNIIGIGVRIYFSDWFQDWLLFRELNRTPKKVVEIVIRMADYFDYVPTTNTDGKKPADAERG